MAAKDPNKRPIIIKKVKKISGGHHGGAWKVAYADFVTAMMAFFLLLWLLAQVPKEKLKGLSDYFTPTVGLKDRAGVNLAGAPGDLDVGIKTKENSTPNVVSGAPPVTGDIAKAPQSDTDEDQIDNDKVKQKNDDEVEAEIEKKHFDQIQKELNDAIDKDASLKAFKNNLDVKQTEEGLEIQIKDLDGVSMFEVGSPNLKIDTQPLIAKVSQVIQEVDNKVAIIGHTDSLSYKNPDYSNWELSADRANASRRFLVNTGLKNSRVYKIEGKADGDPLIADKPDSPQNRRISIILLKKSIAPTDGKTAPAEKHAADGSAEKLSINQIAAGKNHS